MCFRWLINGEVPQNKFQLRASKLNVGGVAFIQISDECT